MESKLVAHLARCDAADLSRQLGEETLALLRKVDGAAVVPNGLAELTVYVFGQEGVLRSAPLRELLFKSLSHKEGEHLCELLDVATYAPGTTLSGVAFDTDQLNANMLRRFFNVSADEEIPPSEATHNAVAAHQLRPHQAEAYRKLRRLFADPTATALVHMPFGAGKLRTVATAVLDLYRAEPDGRVIVWLADGEELCEEAFTELNKIWLQLGSRNVTAFRLFGEHSIPDLDNLQNGLVVIDTQKLSPNDPGLLRLGRRTCVVVIGDAESLRHERNADLVDSLAAEGNFSLVGICASPGKVVSELSALDPISARFSGTCIAIEDSAPLAMLHQTGELDPVSVTVEGIASSRQFEHDLSVPEVSADALVSLSKDVDRNHAIIEYVIARARALESSIVLFCVTAAQARLFAGLLRLRGTRASAITRELSSTERKLELQKFSARSDKVLCVHGLFLSGLDFPSASLAVIATPSTSSSYLNQLVGRLASGRGRPHEPLQVVFLADNVPDYLTIAGGIGSWDALNI